MFCFVVVVILEEPEKHTTRSNMPGLQRTLTSTTTTTTTTATTTAWRRQSKIIVGQPGLSHSPPTGTRVWRIRETHLCGIYDNAPVCCITVQSRHVMMGAWGGGGGGVGVSCMQLRRFGEACKPLTNVQREVMPDVLDPRLLSYASNTWTQYKTRNRYCVCVCVSKTWTQYKTRSRCGK